MNPLRWLRERRERERAEWRRYIEEERELEAKRIELAALEAWLRLQERGR